MASEARVVDAASFRRLVRARDLVHDAFDESLSLDAMAEAAGLSRFHFLRLFRRVFEKTPHAYLTDVRLSRARDLLARGTPVTEACFAVGFTSVGSFSTLFTKKLGLSPRDFQRAVRRVVVVPADLPLLRIPHCFFRAWTPVDDG